VAGSKRGIGLQACGSQVAILQFRRGFEMKYWELIADKLGKAGWSWGYISAVDSNGQTIFVADAHRDNGKRFIVTADEKLRAFLELQRVTRESLRFQNAE
jgi:hypothetical protein